MNTVKEDRDSKSLPKSYLYTVEGVFDSDKEEEELKWFSVPSLGNILEDDFDLDNLGERAALRFYLDYPEYKDITKWPLKFKFYKRKNGSPVEIEMNLYFTPCFLSTPKKSLKKLNKIKERNDCI